MREHAETLVAVGGLMLLSLLTDLLGRHTPLPRVTLMLLLGVLIGPAALDLLPAHSAEWFSLIADMALVMVGFLLGGHLTRRALRGHGRTVLWMSLAVVLVTALVVAAGLFAVGVPLDLALLLAGVAAATDPAATSDVIDEEGARGPFATILLGVVAVDDAWGLILFSLLLSVCTIFNGGAGWDALAAGGWELGGAVVLGLVLGIPAAILTGRIRPGRPSSVEALGIVFLCGGLALWLEVSFLLAAMTLGAAVANLARHHTRPFHAIQGIGWPFLVLFFVLSGASLHMPSLLAVGGLGIAFVLLRTAGRLAGARLGAHFAGEHGAVGRWLGIALLPQAGVALGMALVSADRFPALGEQILAVAIGATVLFEIVGPLGTRWALRKAGEVGA